jgi:tRNA (guanine37-N1)-methyltransferase
MFEIFKYSIIGRAVENDIIDINSHNIRDYSINKHKKVDDYPYGGGAGMVMTPQPVVDSIRGIKEKIVVKLFS